MAEASRLPSLHAPWRKGFIITLFTIQLALALFQFSWNLFIVILAIWSGSDSGVSEYQKNIAIVVMVIGFIVSAILITEIVFFARFTLTSLILMCGSSVAIGLAGISTILAFTAVKSEDVTNIISGTFSALLFILSIWTLVYSILVRRRVKVGSEREMVKPGSRGDLHRKRLEEDSEIPMV